MKHVNFIVCIVTIVMFIIHKNYEYVYYYSYVFSNLPQASITWKQCKEIPVKLSVRKSTQTVINGKVYYGGDADRDDDDYIVCCYDPSQDNWTTLPPLPVKWFGLGQVNGKLVAVGGRKKSSGRSTNKVYTYDEQSKKWKRTIIPPMPTARHSAGVLSLQSALVVAGGKKYYYNQQLIDLTLTTVHPSKLQRECYASAIIIFKADTSQWYKTDPLPKACSHISLVAIGNTCYALGGYSSPLRLNQALYASVDDLLHKANQTTHSGSRDTQSAWKTLQDTPTYRPTAAVLGGHLKLAMGRGETSVDDLLENAVPANQTTHSGSSDTQSAWKTLPDTPTYEPTAAVLGKNLIAISDDKIHMYVPSSESWNCIGELPTVRDAKIHNRVAVNLLPQEILLLVDKAVYKGTLAI